MVLRNRPKKFALDIRHNQSQVGFCLHPGTQIILIRQDPQDEAGQAFKSLFKK